MITENIYQTPKSELDINEPTKGSPVKAVLLASVIDAVGTIILNAIAGAFYYYILNSQGATHAEILSKLNDISPLSTLAILISFCGCLLSAVAAYLCTKIARASSYKVVSIFAIITLLFGIVAGGSTISLPAHLAYGFITLISVYFGAWLYIKKT